MVNIVGNRINKLRKERRWTQKELADQVNVSAQVVSNWERGYTFPDHDDIYRLSKIFNVSADYIIGRVDNPKIEYTETERLLIDTINLGNKEDIEKLLEKIPIEGKNGKELTMEQKRELAALIQAYYAARIEPD